MAGSADQVLVFSPRDASKSQGLLDDLRRDSGVREAVVMERTPDGALRVVDGSGSWGSGTFGGGLIGALVGVLLGPLGILLGWVAGMAVGSSVDAERAEDDHDGLTVLARGIAPGGTVVIAEVSDPSFPAQQRAAAWDAQVVAIPGEQVAAEVESARQAAAAAAAEARKQRREHRKDDFAGHMHNLFHHSSGDTPSS